jgi:hypothetical protein
MELLFSYGFSIQFPNTISKALTFPSTKVLNQEDSKFVEPFLQVVKKISFLHFKRYNLAIYEANFFETSTHYFNSPKQDPIVKSQKNK